MLIIFSFNPHTHEGCDETKYLTNLIDQVSIHTPTKGVTYYFGKRYIYRKVSIHTPTKGVTLGVWYL